MFKKITAFLAALLCLVPVMVGCAGDTTSGSSDTSAAGDTSSTETTSVETTKANTPDLPEMDFDGKSYRIFTWDPADTVVQNDFWADGETGEPLNDAVYQRNATIEERYNVVIETPTATRADMHNESQTSILANEDNWEIVNNSVMHGNLLAQAGYTVEMSALDYIDIEADWWDQRFIENTSIGGKLYQLVGEFNTMTNSQTWGYIFNKNMIEDFSLENPYDHVREGTWTLDLSYDMLKTVVADLNGDGKMDQNDRWGIFSEESNIYQHMLGAGELVASKDSSDMPILTLNNERAVEVLEAAYTLITDKNTSFIAGDWTSIATKSIYTEHIIPMFMRDQGLFYFTGIGNTFKHLRDMESPYGVLPNPKFDESQDEYYNGIAPTWATSVCIPITTDAEFASFIIEALAAESVDTVTEAYFSIIFENKGLRDEDSIEMVDLIINTRLYDIGYLNNWGKAVDQLAAIANATSFDFASRYASIEATMISDMEKTIDIYKNLK